MLRYIQRPETDPYYNLAAEEFLLKSAGEDTFMIWRNDPSVIIGKHQNAAREINHDFIEANHLPVIRRITGGGTVYHDPGNINFSFIYTGRKENLIDFRYFTKPVILFLKSLGLDAAFEGKNNITVNGMKVSGNSAHIYRDKVLHHGTLLFSTDLEKLNAAINGDEKLYQDKSVRSIRSDVVNIESLLNKMTADEFISAFKTFIFSNNNSFHEDFLTIAEKQSIGKLANEKYRTYAWNFGYSPEYQIQNEWYNNDEIFSLSILVKKGTIYSLKIEGPETYRKLFESIEYLLIGENHQKKSITDSLKKITFADEIERTVFNQIAEHLF